MTLSKRNMSTDESVYTDATSFAESQSMRSSTSSNMSRGILMSEGSLRSFNSKMMKRVSFDTVDVCEHAVCLGDNVVSTGAPLTIEWHAQSCDILSVDEYERERLPSRQRRRSSSLTSTGSDTVSNLKNTRPRKLSADERFCMLSLSGIPMRMSLQAAAEASKARMSRQETVDEVLREQAQQLNEQTQTQTKLMQKKPRFFGRTKAILSKLRAR